MSLPYNKNMIPRAKELRKEMTPQEHRLWHGFLRRYPVRFQRQKPIEHFITDFYCHAAKLVIELDGSQHYTPEGLAYDAERETYLTGHGLLVLRYSNAQMDHEFRAVCEEIDRTVQERIQAI